MPAHGSEPIRLLGLVFKIEVDNTLHCTQSGSRVSVLDDNLFIFYASLKREHFTNERKYYSNCELSA